MAIDRQTLYVVATPIGHLADFSHRAVMVLGQCDVILCEDTRVSRVLLQHHGITTPIQAMHRFNEADVLQRHIDGLTQGQSIAIISDAGTPLIQDPGGRLVCACHAQGIRVVPIPGASAIMAALSVAGFSESHFEFVGFLPGKAHARDTMLKAWCEQPHIMVAFEVPHRIEATLTALAHVLPPDRDVVLARELTKKFETIVRLKASELPTWMTQKPVLKGEWVLMVGPAVIEPSALSPQGKQALKVLMTRCSIKDSVAMASAITGDRKNVLYAYAMTLDAG